MDAIVSIITSVMLASIPIIVFYYFSDKSKLGALSLPCFASITTLVYFFVMPWVLSTDPSANYLGIYFTNTHWMQAAVILYFSGAAFACFVFKENLNIKFDIERVRERRYNKIIYYSLVITVAIGIFYLYLTNKLNIFGATEFSFNKEGINEFAFVNVIFNIAISLVLINAIKRDFDLVSFIAIAVLVWILMQTGFRYRILILAAAAATAFFVTKGFRIRVGYTLMGAVVAIFFVNLLGSIRRYGQGIDISRLENLELGNVLTGFSGEAGIAFVTDYTANHPLPEPVLMEPWIVALVRLIPSALWPDKPRATYLDNIVSGATIRDADLAGAAAPQQVEIMFQFGWIGLPVLAFIYFAIVAWLLKRISMLGREARIAGFALVPAFFGYYMQTRGYFSQIFSDALFFFAPLFFIHLYDSTVRRVPRQSWNQAGLNAS